MEKLGALAAFGTAFCWSISAMFFENSSKKISALAVNFWKTVFAFFFLAIAGWIFHRMPLPTGAGAVTWIYLAVSSVLGFLISDYFLFNAYVMIGSRITVIFQSVTPIFTSLFAFIFLGETMKPVRLVGMAVVVCGILLVVLSRQKPLKGEKKVQGAADPAAAPAPPPNMRKGYLFAFLSTVFQAAGLIFSKVGLRGYNSISGTQIRIIVAIIGFAMQALLTGQAKRVFRDAPANRPAFRSTSIGAIFGPFLGVVFSLFALQNTEAGTASTLMALTPVLIIPPSVFILKQKVRAQEIAGAAIAVTGAALFFLL